MPKAMRVCSTPGCPELTADGRCDRHRTAADRARGTSAQRGYNSKQWRAARRAVLRRNPVCVICHVQAATVADHHPVGRRDLVALGVTDPDAPFRMRGLCGPCHGTETANNPAQAGGWNRRDWD